MPTPRFSPGQRPKTIDEMMYEVRELGEDYRVKEAEVDTKV